MSGRNDRVKKSIIILCLLGDPALPAGSFDRTGGFNVDMTEILNYWSAFSYPITVITNSSSYLSSNDELLYDNIQLHRISMDDTILNNQQTLKDIFPRILQETIDYIEQNKICPVFIHSYEKHRLKRCNNQIKRYTPKHEPTCVVKCLVNIKQADRLYRYRADKMRKQGR